MKKTACAAARAFSFHRVVTGIVLHMFQHVADWKHMNRLAQSIKRMIQTDRETQNQTELPDQKFQRKMLQELYSKLLSVDPRL